MIPWTKITMFGDTVVMMPAAAIIAVWLLAGRAWRMALWWGLLFTLGLIAVAATKIAFIGWGIGISALDFTGISGHAMRASAVLPVIASLLLQPASPPARTAGITLGVALGLLIGESHIVLGYHSVSEVVAGCLLGSAVGLGFIRMSDPLSGPQLDRRLAALSLFALLPTSYAEPAPTQGWITSVALYLSGHDKPYVRATGKLAHSARSRPNAPAFSAPGYRAPSLRLERP
jgi:membrane-associated phospholipid phosphatase